MIKEYDTSSSIFLATNPQADLLREQMITNLIKIPACNHTELEEVFFSEKNIDLLNKKIILGIFKMTNGEYNIKLQTNENLLIVMRYIFIEYAKHLPTDIKTQIKELNCAVINEVIPQLITNITQHTTYLKDISSPLVPLPSPINTRKSKTQKSITTTF